MQQDFKKAFLEVTEGKDTIRHFKNTIVKSKGRAQS